MKKDTLEKNQRHFRVGFLDLAADELSDDADSLSATDEARKFEYKSFKVGERFGIMTNNGSGWEKIKYERIYDNFVNTDWWFDSEESVEKRIEAIKKGKVYFLRRGVICSGLSDG